VRARQSTIMRTRLAITLSVLAGLLLASGLRVSPAVGSSSASPVAAAVRTRIRESAASDSKRDCVYSANSERVLARFEALVHRRINCVEVYDNESQTWAEWAHPWFLNDQPGYAWSRWATAPGSDRQLVFDQSLIPTSLAHTAWRAACARGQFVSDARALARNLVAAGLSHSIIRLAGEMNGTWNIDNVGQNRRQMREWAGCWRRTVLAMRHVPGATFTIDFSINAAVRPLALRAFYPGNRTVDIIGIDAYDQGIAPGQNRWESIYDRPDGIRDVLAFARANHKPLSIPEWGLAGAWDGDGGGDDPAYVRGIADIVRGDDVAYQSYFFNHGFATELARDRRSLRLYRTLFGVG
jgi:glycosyl hydrolase family 26